MIETSPVYTVNNNDNNTTGEITAYEWDCFDRLTKVTMPAKGGATSGETVEFEYDLDGMLIGEKSGGMERKFTQQNRFATREVIKNGQDEWETSAMHVIHGTMLASYIGATSRQFGGKQQISHDTKTIFYHTDHLGSVRLITDSHGNVVSSSTTDAYGNPLPRATANPDTPPGSPKNKDAKMLSNFNFIGTHGIRYVEKVKLHNMRARWYSNIIRRFKTPDPLKGYDNTIFVNEYIYAGNNSINNIDITGKFKQSFNRKNRFGNSTITIESNESKYVSDKVATSLCKIEEEIYFYCRNPIRQVKDHLRPPPVYLFENGGGAMAYMPARPKIDGGKKKLINAEIIGIDPSEWEKNYGVLAWALALLEEYFHNYHFRISSIEEIFYLWNEIIEGNNYYDKLNISSPINAMAALTEGLANMIDYYIFKKFSLSSTIPGNYQPEELLKFYHPRFLSRLDPSSYGYLNRYLDPYEESRKITNTPVKDVKFSIFNKIEYSSAKSVYDAFCGGLTK